jgi:N-sulfoglucosamine sulfohydrolase
MSDPSARAALTRRKFLHSAAAAAPAVLAAQQPAANASRPNILFCIADDQSYPHASAYGTKWISTPAFDRIAKEGALFHNAFVSSPSCCPSRGSALTGQDFYRLKDASMNHTAWPGGIPLYPDLLSGAGYHTGFTGKGWGPGEWKATRKTNPAGAEYNQVRLKAPGEQISPIDYAANFEAFLKKKPAQAPFCFWVGFQEPHRRYDPGIGVKNGKRLADIRVPQFLPDSPEVRSDLADYAFEIEWHDQQLARILKILESRGELDNTLIVVTADNGMPFPRAKANVYDYGARVPLAMRWGGKIKPGRVVEDFVSFIDFAPTFLEAAGLTPPIVMTGRSLMPVLTAAQSGQVDPDRSYVVMGIERHFPGSRAGGLGYPVRAIRTKEYLYIVNTFHEGSPAGDHPGPVWPPDDPTAGYGDIDGGPTKTFLWENRQIHARLFELTVGKRSKEELYHVLSDPFCLNNLTPVGDYTPVRKTHYERMRNYQLRTRDPRITESPILDEVMKKYPAVRAQ